MPDQNSQLPTITNANEQRLLASPQYMQELTCEPAQGPDSRKKRLRAEQLRWHPDKFGARFGSRLVDADKAEIMQRVSALSCSLADAVKQL